MSMTKNKTSRVGRIRKPRGIETPRRDLETLCRAYERMSKTSDGILILEDLRLRFGRFPKLEDPHITVVVAARRTVIDYIDACIELGGKDAN